MKKTRRSKRYMGDRPECSATQCEHEGCTQPGVYRAPRDRTLSEYMWLCLEHVREYNKSWDFYAGLSQAEIESEVRDDTVWHRPTWRFGDGNTQDAGHARMRDPFSFFDGEDETAANAPRKPKAEPGSPEYAMEILGLDVPLTRQALKLRYHALVKEHHPDRHGGDKAAEERLKIINEAYAILLRQLDGGTRKTAV